MRKSLRNELTQFDNVAGRRHVAVSDVVFNAAALSVISHRVQKFSKYLTALPETKAVPPRLKFHIKNAFESDLSRVICRQGTYRPILLREFVSVKRSQFVAVS